MNRFVSTTMAHFIAPVPRVLLWQTIMEAHVKVCSVNECINSPLVNAQTFGLLCHENC